VGLVNLKNLKQKVASRKINGHWGLEKFHGSPILELWFKMDVMIVHLPKAPFMHMHELDD
jgi:hypothetical protein